MITTLHSAAENELDAHRLESLPLGRGTRWTVRRKADVVMAVHDGVLSFDDALKRYALSVEEFLSWQDLVVREGLKAFRPANQTRRATAARDRQHSIALLSA